MMALKLERIYTQPADLDGYRILVDRLWPRGMSKEKAHLDEWLRGWPNQGVAPVVQPRTGQVPGL